MGPKSQVRSRPPLEQSGFELLVPLTAGTPLCDALGVQKRKYSDAAAALMLAFTEGADAAPLRSADRGRGAGRPHQGQLRRLPARAADAGRPPEARIEHAFKVLDLKGGGSGSGATG